MAPSWVLLHRQVPFPHDPIRIPKEELSKNEWGTPPSDEEMRDAITAYLQTLKPDAQLDDPPKLSSLRMLPPTKSIPPLCGGVTSAQISSADKNLVVLYAGAYRPACGILLEGCYLIYDAIKNSVSTIPQLPFDHSHHPIAPPSAVVVCDEDGDGYVLAELIRTSRSDDAEAALYLWYSSAQEWVVKAGRLPVEVCSPTYHFSAEMCFSFGSSILCWVDLLKGMVVCDLRALQEHGSDPEFRFVPLPEGCPTYEDYGELEHRDRMRGEEFRSMSCLGGAVKFVTMQGYGELPASEVMLTIWTLSSDLGEWKKCMAYRVAEIWENETYRSMGLLQHLPSFPVLSVQEDGVVYLVVTDARVVAGDRLEFRDQYLLRVDVSNNKVQFCPESIKTKWVHFQLFASEFSAYMQGVQDHPVHTAV